MAADNPYPLLARWLREGAKTLPRKSEPEQWMTLATATPSGRPAARIVLWKGLSPEGAIRFVTNYDSRKGHELEKNPACALVLYWPKLGRQLRIEGRAQKWSTAESDSYWHSRSRSSQLGGWASHQSQPIRNRAELLRSFKDFDRRFQGRDVPRPAGWGGFNIKPASFEFWLNQADRMHDRHLYKRASSKRWTHSMLAP